MSSSPSSTAASDRRQLTMRLLPLGGDRLVAHLVIHTADGIPEALCTVFDVAADATVDTLLPLVRQSLRDGWETEYRAFPTAGVDAMVVVTELHRGASGVALVGPGVAARPSC